MRPFWPMCPLPCTITVPVARARGACRVPSTVLCHACSAKGLRLGKVEFHAAIQIVTNPQTLPNWPVPLMIDAITQVTLPRW